MNRSSFTNSACLILAFACFCTSVQAVTVPGPLVDTQWVENNKTSIKIIDARGDMPSYADAHIPLAALVSFKAVRGDSIEEGLPLQDMHLSKEAFEELMRAAGVSTAMLSSLRIQRMSPATWQSPPTSTGR